MQLLARYSVGLSAFATLITASAVRAGELVETLPPAPVESRSLIDPVTGAISAGYDSTYMFRGSNLGRHAPWAEIDFFAPVGDFTIDAGAWYINPASPDGGILSDANDELDLYISATATVGVFDLWIGYTAYIYPESNSDATNEVGVGFRTSINFLDLGFGYYHDFDLNTNYFEYSLGKNIDLNEFTALNLSLIFGHVGTRNFHGVVAGSLDFALTDTATLSTYIAYNFVDKERSATGFEDRLFGGVSLSVSF